MFAQLSPASARRQRWLLAASVTFHGLLLAWVLRAPEAQKLQLQNVLLGRNGASVTRLYWSSKTPDNSDHSSADTATQRYQHERLGGKLTYQKPLQTAKNSPPTPLTPANKADNARTQTVSSLGHGAQAGTPYGSLYRGTYYGDDVRPAIPATTSDPVVYPWQLPNVAGNEVIEVTIDERGEIVAKKVLESLGPEIDDKCLAALENWHFRPATKNGAPIPSKQDTVFPFKARG